MLDRYGHKRDFELTREPPAKAAPQGRGPLIFVVQKHAARNLHYDFRLEVDGVLKSWPVPKGPSLNPKEKRLAMQVEDHPLEYASFEGVIPQGSYGAGRVIVWDAGTYSPDEGGRLSFHDREEANARVARELAAGKLAFTLRGHKLKGSWTLVHTKRGPTDWLLIKHGDGFADAVRDVLAEERSVLSGLTIDDLREGRLPDPARHTGLPGRIDDLPGVRAGAIPARLRPMLAELAVGPFSDPNWLFEPKLDGLRALAFVRDGQVTLLSRNANDITTQYPALVGELAAQPAAQMLLDGEIVALDEQGLPSFQLLQQRMHLTRPADIQRQDTQTPVLYYVFDLLHLDGFDLTKVPLAQRKATLAQALLPSSLIRYVDHVDSDGEEAYRQSVKLGLEGVVAKRRDWAYEAGKRSRAWLKVKGVLSAEFVVGGYSQGSGERAATFGALLLGYYDDGRLVYAGNVGSGFDQAGLKEIHRRLEGLRSERPPFAEEPPLGKTKAVWVRPQLVAEVKFAQWTHEGRLRAPVFLRLREEIRPREVRRPPSPLAVGPAQDPPSKQALADATSDVLAQLEGSRQEMTLSVQDHKLNLTNLNKALWPATAEHPAVTKRDLVAYFARAAPYILPHLKDRPLTLTRYPNGIHGGHFYQKHWQYPPPGFVEKVRLYSSHTEVDQEYMMVNDLPTLLWLAQLADIELHPWLSRVDPNPDARHLSTDFAGSKENIERSTLNYPDFMIFDLDPYIYSGKERPGDEPELNRKAWAKVREVALHLKEILDQLSLSSFLKTSGRTGLHVYVPVLRQYDYDVLRHASTLIADFLRKAQPDDITLEWTVSKRGGKVFLDQNQNTRGKTLASIYSPRPLPEATVSMPITWDELGRVYPTDFTIFTAPERLAAVGDLWADILAAKHDLEGLLSRAETKSP
jgi:bifunctional non-homologous end joining protein LigD